MHLNVQLKPPCFAQINLVLTMTIIIIIITWIYIAPFKQPKALYKLGGLRKGRKEK